MRLRLLVRRGDTSCVEESQQILDGQWLCVRKVKIVDERVAFIPAAATTDPGAVQSVAERGTKVGTSGGKNAAVRTEDHAACRGKRHVERLYDTTIHGITTTRTPTIGTPLPYRG